MPQPTEATSVYTNMPLWYTVDNCMCNLQLSVKLNSFLPVSQLFSHVFGGALYPLTRMECIGQFKGLFHAPGAISDAHRPQPLLWRSVGSCNSSIRSASVTPMSLPPSDGPGGPSS